MRPRDFQTWMLRAGLAASTAKSYAGYVTRAERYLTAQGRGPLRHASWEDINDWGDTLPYRNSSRSAARSAIKTYWVYLGRATPPHKAIRCPRKPKLPARALPSGTIEKVLISARDLGPRPYAVVCALYYQALRAIEAATLEWDNLDPDELRVIGKHSKEAVLPMHPRAWEAISSLPRNGTRWVFPGRYPGTHIAYNTVNVWVKLAGAGAGLGDTLVPHVLRHTCLTDMNDGSENKLRFVQEFARHEDPRTTARYTRVVQQQLRGLLDHLADPAD